METPDGYGTGPNGVSTSSEIEVLCGPLLNYQRMSEEGADVFWHGSVLLVTKLSEKRPQLELQPIGPVEGGRAGASSHEEQKQVVDGLKLYADPNKTFWRLSLRLPLAEVETKWQYTLPDVQFLKEVNKSRSREFIVPASTESMRIMFHSCNGFSVGTDEDFWSGMSR